MVLFLLFSAVNHLVTPLVNLWFGITSLDATVLIESSLSGAYLIQSCFCFNLIVPRLKRAYSGQQGKKSENRQRPNTQMRHSKA